MGLWKTIVSCSVFIVQLPNNSFTFTRFLRLVPRASLHLFARFLLLHAVAGSLFACPLFLVPEAERGLLACTVLLLGHATGLVAVLFGAGKSVISNTSARVAAVFARVVAPPAYWNLGQVAQGATLSSRAKHLRATKESTSHTVACVAAVAANVFPAPAEGHGCHPVAQGAVDFRPAPHLSAHQIAVSLTGASVAVVVADVIPAPSNWHLGGSVVQSASFALDFNFDFGHAPHLSTRQVVRSFAGACVAVVIADVFPAPSNRDVGNSVVQRTP